jgi:hypothetical protein
MGKFGILAAVSLPLVLMGCGPSMPDCASKETKDLVLQITHDAALVGPLIINGIPFSDSPADKLGHFLRNKIPEISIEYEKLYVKAVKGEVAGFSPEEFYRNIKISVDAIRLTSKNEQTGSVVCAANLTFKMDGFRNSSIPVTYNLETTSDKKLYGTVYGLK